MSKTSRVLALLFSWLCACVGEQASAPELYAGPAVGADDKVSAPGRYSGYSEPHYDSFKITS